MFRISNIYLAPDDTEGGNGSVATPAQGGTVQTDTSGGFSFDDFKGLREAPAPDPTPAQTQEEPVEPEPQEEAPEPEVEEGVEARLPKAGDGEIPVDLGGPKPAYPEKRDYTGIDSEHVKFFKNMKNESFAALKPIYQQWKEATAQKKTYEDQLGKLQKQTAPKYHYDHPEAYTLADDFRSAVHESALAEQVLGHLGQQLTKLRLAEPWVPISVSDDGKIIKGAPVEPSAEAEAQVLQSLARLESYKSTLNGKMETIKAGFASGRQGVLAEISNFQEKAFPFWDKLNDREQKEYMALRNDLPPYLKNTDFADVVAKSIYTAKLALDKFNELSKKQKITQTNVAQQQKSGSVKSSVAGANGASRDPWDTSDFDRLKAATR